ncbi:MAG: hypothetical protein ACYCSB_00755 [bacterium]
MKILYLIKEKYDDDFLKSIKDIIDAQISEGSEVLIVNLYDAQNIDYDILADKIFEYDRVVCI